MAEHGHTLALDADGWDLTLDASGNIAVTSGDYAVAQNVANAVRLFTDDAYFDPDRGIPHFATTLGHKPALSVFRSRVRKAAQGVDGVATVSCSELAITKEANQQSLTGEKLPPRTLTGDIRITLEDGETYVIAV